MTHHGPARPGDEDLPGDRDLTGEDERSEADPHDEGLRALLASGLFAGPDPSVVDDVLADSDDDAPEDDDEYEPSGSRARTGTGVETQALAEQAEADAEAARVYREILARAPEHRINPGLERVAGVLELLGDPQHAYPVIHVAGTNGKSSTARIAESLLRERGLRTGRFTSPHLSSVRERIAIDGESISPERFVAVWEDVRPYIELIDDRSVAAGDSRLNFFEVLTVMAFAAFADAPVDVAVIEVGLGGKWDSTNVATAQVAVITSIDRDHQKWLGDTLESIAAQKAGIITPGSIVVSAEQREEVAPVIRDAAYAQDARLLSDGAELAVIDRQLGVGGQLLTLRTAAATYTDVFLPLHGAHQAANALLALAAVEAFFGGGALDGGVVEQGVAAATSPGRLELVRTSPAILVDAAHNPAGLEASRVAIEEAFEFTRLVGVVGVMADKDVEAMLSVLEPLLAHIVVTSTGSERAMDADDLAEIAREIFDPDQVHVADRLDEALDVAIGLAEFGDEPGAGVLVTGSIPLVADARMLAGRGRPD